MEKDLWGEAALCWKSILLPQGTIFFWKRNCVYVSLSVLGHTSVVALELDGVGMRGPSQFYFLPTHDFSKKLCLFCITTWTGPLGSAVCGDVTVAHGFDQEDKDPHGCGDWVFR